MRDEDFRKHASIDEQEEAVSSSLASDDSITYQSQQGGKRKGKSAPYRTYLHQRQVFFWVKVGLLVVAIAGFVTWFLLLQGRS